MEEALFRIMETKGFGDHHVKRYKMVSRFHMQRRPLIIFICGSACSGARANEGLACGPFLC